MDCDGRSLQKVNAFSCKICHDEDEDSNMETPCSCNGTLKYAHRKCVQRWCNEKGDTTCEICHQQFEPDYEVPHTSHEYSGPPLNNRGNWEDSRRYLLDYQFIDMVATDHDFLYSDYGDYADLSSKSLLCCRMVTIIFLVLLFLRHTLPIIIGGIENGTITFFMSVMLSSIGIFLPIYVMVKALYTIKCRRRRQASTIIFAQFTIRIVSNDADIFGLGESDEENDLPRQPDLIHVL